MIPFLCQDVLYDLGFAEIKKSIILFLLLIHWKKFDDGIKVQGFSNQWGGKISFEIKGASRKKEFRIRSFQGREGQCEYIKIQYLWESS